MSEPVNARGRASRRGRALASLIAVAALILLAWPLARTAESAAPARASATGAPAAAAVAAPETAAKPASGGFVGSGDCKECHGPQHAAVMDGPHRALFLTKKSRTPDRVGCEACHGPASAHVEGDQDKVYPPNTFKLMKPAAINAVCLSCHKTNEALAEVRSGPHAGAGLSCVSCHSAHGGIKSASLKKNQTDLCLSCHKAQRAQMNLPSHHPVREGKMSCNGCHNPHGGSARLLKQETVNETCVQCHQQYAGPFTFEHAPVALDCLTCHRPHGSVQRILLNQQQPSLCFKCHRNPHVGFLRVGAGEGLARTPRRLARGLEYQQCSYCHPKIHGSNEVPTFTN